MPDFRMQPNAFPIASVIDAAQRNNALQLQARTQGQQSLIEGMKAIGQVGQSLYDQKMRIAQALAQADIYKKNHPELFNKVETVTKSQAPINRNETASFDPSTGAVTPNTGMSGVAGQVPLTRRVESNGSFSIPDKTLQDAFMGMTANDFFDNQVQNRAAKTGEADLAFKEKYKPQELAIDAKRASTDEMLRMILANIESGKAKEDKAKNKVDEINSLLKTKADLTKMVSTGFFSNDQSDLAKSQIKEVDQKLATLGYGASHLSTQELLDIVNGK
jgi:hypothetical protein